MAEHRRLSEQSALMRALLRDPMHLPEILLLHAQAKLSPGAEAWAAKASDDRASSVRKAQRNARTAARIDGAISGTPFLIALIPAYVASLWEQARLALRMAALSGRDPSSPETAAELLVLRGVHPDLGTAREALASAAAEEREAMAAGKRNKVIETYRLGMRVLLFAAFLDPPEGKRRSRFRQAVGFVFACLLWVVTWIVPLAFMALMSWSCESSTKRMAQLTIEGWLPDLEPPPPETVSEKVLRIIGVLVIGVAPLAVIAFAVGHPGQRAIAFASLLGVIEAFALGILVARDGRVKRER